MYRCKQGIIPLMSSKQRTSTKIQLFENKTLHIFFPNAQDIRATHKITDLIHFKRSIILMVRSLEIGAQT